MSGGAACQGPASATTLTAASGRGRPRGARRRGGAPRPVDYTTDDWPEQARDAAPGGVGVVLDSVGLDVLRSSLGLLAPFGRMVVYGAASEVTAVPVTDVFALRTVAGFSLLAWRQASPEAARVVLVEVAELAADGRLRTTTSARIPLAEAAQAHRMLEERTALGRVLVLP